MGNDYLRDKRSPIPFNENVSKVMRSNRSKNKKPELMLRKALCGIGLRGYRLDWKKVPGNQILHSQVERSRYLYMDVIGIGIPLVTSLYQKQIKSFGKQNLKLMF